MHEKVVCTGGALISQCRCMGPHNIRTEQHGCSRCKRDMFVAPSVQQTTSFASLPSLVPCQPEYLTATGQPPIQPTQAALVSKAKPHPFEYHKPTARQVEVMKAVNDQCRITYDIMTALPQSAELTLATRKLQEARMWFNAACVLNEGA